MSGDLTPACFAATASEVGEGPFWWDAALWWVDINPGLLHRCAGAGKPVATWHLGARTGAVVPVAGTRDAFLAAQQTGIWRIRLDGGRVAERVLIADPESGLPDNRFNDGKCDPAGRFWAGTMSRSRLPAAGALYCLDSGVGILKKLERVSLSNGLDWSPDGRRFFFIDTPSGRIDVFDFEPASGEISNRRTLIECPPEWGMPDGMTVDRDGMLWVGFWDGSSVRCIDPGTGGVLCRIDLPCSRVTSCCFGGENLEHLFITTARGIDDGCKDQPMAGHVFTCKPGICGKPVHPFGLV